MNDFDNLGRLYVLCGGTKEDFCMEGHRLVKMIHKLSEDIDEEYFLAWLIAHADCVTIMGDGDLMILDDSSKYETTERVAKHTVSSNGSKCIICTGSIIDFNDDYIEVCTKEDPYGANKNYERLGKLYVQNGGTFEALCRTNTRVSKLQSKINDNETFDKVMKFLDSNMERAFLTDDGNLEVYPSNVFRSSSKGHDELLVMVEINGPCTRKEPILINPKDIKNVYAKSLEFKIDIKPRHDEKVVTDTAFHDIYKQLLDGYADILNELQVALMKEGYSNETELHNDKGAADCKCKGTAEKARTTCKRNRGCRTCGKGRKD